METHSSSFKAQRWDIQNQHESWPLIGDISIYTSALPSSTHVLKGTSESRMAAGAPAITFLSDRKEEEKQTDYEGHSSR